MKMKAIKLTLPTFAFLDGNSPKGDTLEDRMVILHVRSASVLEFFHDEVEVLLKDTVISKQFSYINRYGIEELITCAVRYSPLVEGKELILSEIVEPAIEWYKQYLDWEDINIVRDITNNNISKSN